MLVNNSYKIAVVIPCYCVKNHILALLESIGPNINSIYVIDDHCPEHTGEHVKNHNLDSRVSIIRNSINLGVGGAVLTGYRQAISDGADVIIKLDGDGQMDPALIEYFINPIINGEADYTKGNRFFNLESLQGMPKIRLIGNAILSFMTKLSSGYWNIFDPTNGYTAIHRDVAIRLPLDKISTRYFFESDMLFRLNTLRAVVVDIPMDAKYKDEVSNLRISRVLGEFLQKNLANLFKRIFYNYYLRDMSIASLELPAGLFLMTFGAGYGVVKWIEFSSLGLTTPPGTVMLSALPLIIGFQLVLSFLSYDISMIPKRPIHLSIR